MRISVDEVRAVIALHGAGVKAGIQYLSDYLEGMDYSKVFELEVLMDFGREWYEEAANGEQGAEISLLDCYHAYEKYADNPDGKASAINYLVGKSLLAEYLRVTLEHCDPSRVQLPHPKEQACVYKAPEEADDIKTCQDELARIQQERSDLYLEYAPQQDFLMQLWRIQNRLDSASKQLNQPEKTSPERSRCETHMNKRRNHDQPNEP